MKLIQNIINRSTKCQIFVTGKIKKGSILSTGKILADLLSKPLESAPLGKIRDAILNLFSSKRAGVHSHVLKIAKNDKTKEERIQTMMDKNEKP